jgi:citrate synthase
MAEVKTALPEGYKPGLEGVIAGTSAIAEVDAQKDALIYRGYVAHELAEKATYEEVAHLLLLGKLPNKKELSSFKAELKEHRPLSAFVMDSLKHLPAKASPMIGLRVGVTRCYFEDPDGDSTDAEANLRKAIRLVAKAATVVAAISRLHKGLQPIPPDPKLDHAANFLYMESGKKPDPEVARVMDSTLILYAEHGYNASTFAARVTASTLSDMHSAVASAIGALKGPLHGGANEAAIEMLLKIGSPDKAEEWVRQALERKEKIMGFGHRVYKHQDSRAPLMKKLAEQMAKRVGDTNLFETSCRVEEAVKRAKNLFPNVDYHCAVAYHLMGLPIEIYTPIFALARMAGWTAHIAEQHAANRLIRPECIYTGERDLAFVPIDKRN